MAEAGIIQVAGLWKRYGLPLVPAMRDGAHRLLVGLGVPLSPPSTLPWALQDLAFTAYPGETLGIVGRNGSGKSTLLKVLAGVSRPTRGTVAVRGSIFSMIELNAGIHWDLTGRENATLLAAVIGLPAKSLPALMPKIEAFCELGAWFDRPVRMYSSGMLVRLGFSVGVFTHSDILLMDEVMAVGDEHFQNKCLRHLEAVRGQGRCILFVSHNMMNIRRICNRVLVLDQGRPLFFGGVEEGVDFFENVLQKSNLSISGAAHSFDYSGIGLVYASMLRPDGTALPDPVAPGDSVLVKFALQCVVAVELVVVNVILEQANGQPVIWSALKFPALQVGSHTFELCWDNLRLLAGSYSLRLGVTMGVMNLKAFRATGVAHLRMGGAAGLGFYAPETRFIQEGQ